MSLGKSLARSERGFTLIELMIVIVLLGVLAALAGPAFRGFIVEQRARATLVDLRIALMTARSEALKRNRSILVSPAAGGWSEGWRIAHPDSPSPPATPLPDLLEHAQSGRSDIGITVSGGTVGFVPSGRAVGPVVFTVVVGSGANTLTRCLSLDTGGYMDNECA